MIPSTFAAAPVSPTGLANTDFHEDLIVALMELGRQSPAQETTKPEKPTDQEQEMADLEAAATKVEQAAAELEAATTGLEEALTKLEETATGIKCPLAKPEEDTAGLEEAEPEGAAAIYPAQIDLEQALQGASSQVRHAVELGDLKWNGNHDPNGYPIVEGASPEKHDKILLTTNPNAFEATGMSFPPSVSHHPYQVHTDFECALWGFWCYHNPTQNTQECYEALTKGMTARYGEEKDIE